MYHRFIYIYIYLFFFFFTCKIEFTTCDINRQSEIYKCLLWVWKTVQLNSETYVDDTI